MLNQIDTIVLGDFCTKKRCVVARKKDQKRYYYDHEPYYAKICCEGGTGWPIESEVSQRFLLKWAREQDFPEYATILEIGCGGGELAIELAKRGIKIEACDLSETAIKICQSKNHPENLTFFVANAMTHKGYPNPPYDWIITNQVLQNIIGGDRVFLLKRMRENLTTTGTIVVATMLGVPEKYRDEFNPVTFVNKANTRFFADLHMFAKEIAEARLKATRHIKIDDHYRIFFLERLP